MLHRDKRLVETPELVEVAETIENAGIDADDAFDVLAELVKRDDYLLLIGLLHRARARAELARQVVPA